jgi:hypothetical protein
VAQFRYLGTTITNKTPILEEIKRKLNSGNACYHSVQNLLSSRLLIEGEINEPENVIFGQIITERDVFFG